MLLAFAAVVAAAIQGQSILNEPIGGMPTPHDPSYADYLANLAASSVEASKTKKMSLTAHPWHGIGWGSNAPEEINVVIEIPSNSRVKTEVDKETGLLFVDRILRSSVVYPENYGFVPQTFGGDSDPVDVLVLCQLPVPAMSVIKARPIGVIPTIDNGEVDDKIIAVAVNDPEYSIYNEIEDLPPSRVQMIRQFFIDYKKLENKHVSTKDPLGSDEAKKIIRAAAAEYSIRFK